MSFAADSFRGVLLKMAHVLERLRRGLLYFTAGTMSLAEFRADIEGTWGVYNTDDEEISSGLCGWEQLLVVRFIKPGS